MYDNAKEKEDTIISPEFGQPAALNEVKDTIVHGDLHELQQHNIRSQHESENKKKLQAEAEMQL